MVSLTACATFAFKHGVVYEALAHGQIEQALASMGSESYSGRDRVVYQLDKAMMLAMLGQYAQSNTVFESAKQAMQQLSATSITENITAVTINEATRSYAGQPYEQLLVHAYKALNYLALDDPNAARVEILQADVKMREWAAAQELEGIKASTFVRYLAGIVYEINQEWSDALIAYRKAYQTLHENATGIPDFLKKDLLRLTAAQGLDDEHQKFARQFNVEDWLTLAEVREQAQVILIHHQGLVSRIQQHSVLHFSPELNYSVRISTPYYPTYLPYVWGAELHVGSSRSISSVIESIDQLARDNLSARLPGITLRTVARVVAKKTAAKEAGKDNSLAGLLVDFAGIVTEIADTRSWSSLPATIQVARVVVPSGEHRLMIPGQRPIEAIDAQRISLRPGQIKVISIHEVVH